MLKKISSILPEGIHHYEMIQKGVNNHYYASLLIGNVIMFFAFLMFPSDNTIALNTEFYISFHKHKYSVIVSLLISFGASICSFIDIIGQYCQYYYHHHQYHHHYHYYYYQ